MFIFALDTKNDCRKVGLTRRPRIDQSKAKKGIQLAEWLRSGEIIRETSSLFDGVKGTVDSGSNDHQF